MACAVFHDEVRIVTGHQGGAVCFFPLESPEQISVFPRVHGKSAVTAVIPDNESNCSMLWSCAVQTGKVVVRRWVQTDEAMQQSYRSSKATASQQRSLGFGSSSSTHRLPKSVDKEGSRSPAINTFADLATAALAARRYTCELQSSFEGAAHRSIGILHTTDGRTLQLILDEEGVHFFSVPSRPFSGKERSGDSVGDDSNNLHFTADRETAKTELETVNKPSQHQRTLAEKNLRRSAWNAPAAPASKSGQRLSKVRAASDEQRILALSARVESLEHELLDIRETMSTFTRDVNMQLHTALTVVRKLRKRNEDNE